MDFHSVLQWHWFPQRLEEEPQKLYEITLGHMTAHIYGWGLKSHDHYPRPLWYSNAKTTGRNPPDPWDKLWVNLTWRQDSHEWARNRMCLCSCRWGTDIFSIDWRGRSRLVSILIRHRAKWITRLTNKRNDQRWKTFFKPSFHFWK